MSQTSRRSRFTERFSLDGGEGDDGDGGELERARGEEEVDDGVQMEEEEKGNGKGRGTLRRDCVVLVICDRVERVVKKVSAMERRISERLAGKLKLRMLARGLGALDSKAQP